jgi:hypothetical protein
MRNSEEEIDAFEARCCQPTLRPREWQRKRAYRAEDELIAAGLHGGILASHDDIWRYALAILRSDWYTARGHPHIARLFLRPSAFGFDHKVGAAGAVRLLGPNQDEVGFLIFPFAGDWRSSRLVVLHEIAHLAQPYAEASHGKHWASIYLSLVHHFLPRLHRPLAESFVRHGVRKNTPAPLTSCREH